GGQRGGEGGEQGRQRGAHRAGGHALQGGDHSAQQQRAQQAQPKTHRHGRHVRQYDRRTGRGAPGAQQGGGSESGVGGGHGTRLSGRHAPRVSGLSGGGSGGNLVQELVVIQLYGVDVEQGVVRRSGRLAGRGAASPAPAADSAARAPPTSTTRWG